MKRIYIEIGSKFGKWTIIGRQVKLKRLMMPCECSCGETAYISKDALLHGKSKGCVSCINGARNKLLVRENSPAWKGGRLTDDAGYIQIYDPTHPRAKKGNGYVREHLVIMEQKIGRSLTVGETVHHISGIRSDNRLENLELWLSSQPPGQRVEDLVKWAKEILSRYGT